MRFCHWYAARDIATETPQDSGILQVRQSHGLVDYPGGKSAMVHYACAENMRSEAEAFVAQHVQASQGWWFRHSTEWSPAERARTDRIFRDLVERFQARFGTVPTLPK